MLVLEDDGGDLLADGDDGVQRSHGVLEDRGDFLTADLGQVLAVLDVGQVQDAGTVEPVFLFLGELDPEGHGTEHIVEDPVVGHVQTLPHGLLAGLQQFVDHAVPGGPVVAAHGQVYFLGQVGVPGVGLQGNGLGGLLVVLLFQHSHFPAIFLIVSGVCLGGLGTRSLGGLPLFVHGLDLVVQVLDLGGAGLDLVLFGGVQGEL